MSASDLILNFAIDNFPSPADCGPWKGTLNGKEASAPIKDSEPVSAVRVQNRRRSLRRPRHLFQSDLRRAEKRRESDQRAHRRRGAAVRTSARCSGKTILPVTELHAGDIGARRQTEGHAHRRHAGRQSVAHRLSARESAGALHRLRHRRQDAQRRRSHGQRDPEDSRRRPIPALLSRSADQGISAGRQRPAARRDHRQPLEETLRRRCRAARAENSLSRNHSRPSRRAGPPQEADRRPRPIRRLLDSHGAAAARREIRVRKRSLRRRDSQELHSRDRKRHRRGRRKRLSGRISRWSISR